MSDGVAVLRKKQRERMFALFDACCRRMLITPAQFAALPPERVVGAVKLERPQATPDAAKLPAELAAYAQARIPTK